METMHYRWAIVLAAATGLTATISPVFYNVLPVFLQSISAETGWGRTQVISSVSVCTGMAMLTSPMVGRLIDRFGPRRVIMFTTIPFGLSLLSLKYLGTNYGVYLLAAALIGFFGNCANTFVYLSFMPRWFDRQLGLSLGLAATGIGIGQTLAPLAASALLGSVGWRNGFAILGLGEIMVTLAVTTLVLRDRPADVGDASACGPANVPEGMTLREAFRTTEFWRLLASIVLVTTAVTGCTLHMVPMLIDHGVAPELAAKMAAITGVCVLAGRFATGFVLDRVAASTVAAVMFTAPAIAVTLLYVGYSVESYYAAVAFLGLALGAEGDIMAYMVRRAFGTRAYGAIYGWLWTAFSTGLLVGPVIMGASFDLLGHYQPMLIVLGLCAVGAAWLVPRIDGVRNVWRREIVADLHSV